MAMLTLYMAVSVTTRRCRVVLVIPTIVPASMVFLILCSIIVATISGVYLILVVSTPPISAIVSATVSAIVSAIVSAVIAAIIAVLMAAVITAIMAVFIAVFMAAVITAIIATLVTPLPWYIGASVSS
jgi:hypothetical protein